MTRRKLKIDPEFDFLLIGLVTPLQDYRLAWWINKTLHKALARVEDVTINQAEGLQQTNFSRFDYPEALTHSYWHLLRNREGSAYLVPELRELDFLLLVRGEYYRPRVTSICATLRKIDAVQAVAQAEVQPLRSRNNLILEIP